MLQKVFLKPVFGKMVFDPKTGMKLPKEGKMVLMDSYWLRRLWAKEVEQVLKSKAKQDFKSEMIPEVIKKSGKNKRSKESI